MSVCITAKYVKITILEGLNVVKVCVAHLN